jgi:hypothetical protein
MLLCALAAADAVIAINPIRILLITSPIYVVVLY